MRKKTVVLLLGLVVIVSGWWIVRRSSLAQPEQGVVDVWATWGEDPDQLQALLDGYSKASGVPVRVRTGVDGDQVLKAMTGPTPPDVLILSSGEAVKSYHEQGLVEPLDDWIEATAIDLDDIYPAPLAPCQTSDGAHLCLPWGCNAFALFWNKDLFEAAGLDPERPPQTMEELAEYADKLTVRDEKGELSQIGFIPDFPRPHTGLYARMFGGFWTSDDGTELTVNSRPMIEAANWQLQFYEKHGISNVQGFVSSFDRYVSSSHPVYGGRRLGCQQCHRANPRVSARIPEHGFYDGKVAMMVGGQWSAAPSHMSLLSSELSYGVAPFPPPADQLERANTTWVEGPVVLMPAGARDDAAAAKLLAWMVSPEVVAEEAYTHSNLPTSRAAAEDPRFQRIPGFEPFMKLMTHPNARGAVTTPISPALNEALGRVEGELLHGKGGNPVPLLDEVQAELSSKLHDVLVQSDRR
jgi:multiple sugar transport system substrate-binding protein